eukprot:TRINITY_DN14115_c0_g2_i1.p1 TRINITY_DN14115_c0_g2~~TRINITY_DN14115_c0_g2_i1.p1  ORF type:complete len:441 (-),score=103.94 TRINITY_DN14115_c0_g2_i1:10-1332(-)
MKHPGTCRPVAVLTALLHVSRGLATSVLRPGEAPDGGHLAAAGDVDSASDPGGSGLLRREASGAIAAAEAPGSGQKNPPRGVFVYKVHDALEVSKSLCALSNFFNAAARYAVRVFADTDKAKASAELRRIAGEGVDLQVVVDDESWHQLPSFLTGEEKKAILATCTHLAANGTATTRESVCSQVKTPIGYIHMEFWRYWKMPLEPSLQQFDYFINVDADAFLTAPLPLDPFELMASNKLVGFFNIQAYETIALESLQEALEAEFSLAERRLRFLDSPATSPYWFDGKGTWGGSSFDNAGLESPQKGFHASIWGCFYGGRLSFFKSERYRRFARRLIVDTYVQRLDEQPVIGLAWALLSKGTDVWYLPTRGINLNIFHHGWLDNCAVLNGSRPWRRVCLGASGWHHFDEPRRQSLISVEAAWAQQEQKLWMGCLNAPEKRR